MTIRPISRMPDDMIVDNQSQLRFQLTRITPSIASVFSSFIKRGNPLDERWFVSMDMSTRVLDNIDDGRERDWQTQENFWDSIDGGAGRFTLFDPARQLPRGRATGIGIDRERVNWSEVTNWQESSGIYNPGETIGYVNKGALRHSTEIELKGMLASQERCLVAGDKFSIYHGPEEIECLYKVMYTTPSDSSGVCHVRFKPGLRYGTPINALVNFFRPRGTFMLINEPEIILSQGLQGSSSFQAIEVPEVLDEPQLLSQFGNIG